MKMKIQLLLAAGLVLGMVVCATARDDDFPLPADFSGTYRVAVAPAALPDGRAEVMQITLKQAKAPDGSTHWSALDATIPGYTYVKGDIEGENPSTAEFDLEFRNASGGKVDVDGTLVLDGNTIKLYGEWEEADVETRMTGEIQR